MRRITSLAIALLAIVAVLLLPSCKSGEAKTERKTERKDVDTLRVATLYGPTSYFTYRDQEMGYDYEMAMDFAKSIGRPMKLTVAPNMSAMIEMLQSGKVDLIAYDIPMTTDFKEQVLHCGPVEITSQVLVQTKTDSLITDVTELSGKTVTVEKGSKYEQRMDNLSKELGGVIDVQSLERDTLNTEDFIKMVSTGDISLTVVDTRTADLNKSYYPGLDMTVEVGLPQRASWAVRLDDLKLAELVDQWSEKNENKSINMALHKKYFEQSQNEFAHFDTTGIMLNDGRISKYDESFRKHAESVGWDWRMLAAVGFTESRFRPQAKSWVGARGIMQIMPKTAASLGLKASQMENPDANINAAARYLAKLDGILKNRIQDPNERMKFVLACYNGGIGHVYDSMALAKKHGKNPQVWEGNVADAALMKSKPQYYNDPVVKHGYFRGRETVDYVDRVMNAYFYYKKNVKS